ncbi:MAG: polysaccharide pyruvyl transferase family protein [Rickettsiales bacterium]|jgi:hypothetical protein|nr:polysaccharide pyruvyl transferase family protein [Rickettsiales bacterium]
MNDKDKFGLMVYNCTNIGDTVQSLAARRFLPHIDRYVPREQIALGNGKFPVKIILNAWWGTYDKLVKKIWPPKDDIIPLCISMHMHKSLYKTFSSKKSVEWLKKWGPVGCRDMDSVKLLEAVGVPSYFSGCLTSTLLPNPKIKRDDYILCIDLDDKLVDIVQQRAGNHPVFNISKWVGWVGDCVETMDIAEAMLATIQGAHCVVSSNLHSCMPAVALGTPCLHLYGKHPENFSRFGGNDKCFNKSTFTEFIQNKSVYDFNNPPPNPIEYKKIAKNLVATCKKITGFDSRESQIKNIYPAIALLRVMKLDKNKNKRIPYFIRLKYMIRVILARVFLHKNRYHISTYK